MESIEINVQKEIAEKWRNASPEIKARIKNNIEKELTTEESPGTRDEFQQFLDEIRCKVKERGLTEEKLQKILSDED